MRRWIGIRERTVKSSANAFYGDFEAVFGLDGELLAGNFPHKQSAFVKAWALLHEDELAANWKLAANGEVTFRIEPLR